MRAKLAGCFSAARWFHASYGKASPPLIPGTERAHTNAIRIAVEYKARRVPHVLMLLYQYSELAHMTIVGAIKTIYTRTHSARSATSSLGLRIASVSYDTAAQAICAFCWKIYVAF